jgi:UDP-N-acetylmuramyl pentapeptide phosphotransferase/UDP-N-acetylglucosamine-1-phosphate transferase
MIGLTADIGVAAGLSFVIALLLTPVVRSFGHGLSLIDVPNERSSHFAPTPRTGGIAILIGIIAAIAATGLLRYSATTWIIVGTVALATLSLYDDLRPLPHHFRLVAQIIIAALVVSLTNVGSRSIDLPFLGTIDAGFIAAPIVVFWIVGVTNAFNFMDGINGIASLEAVICAVVLAGLMAQGGDLAGAVFAAAVAGAAAGFLPWNLGGSIFMGDVGSAGLGFLLSILVLRTSRVAPGVAAMLPLVPFLFDATLTLVRRAVRGEKWFSTPHRSHYYQRLVASGLSHVSVSLMYATLAAISGALALIYGQLSDSARVLGIVLLILIHLAFVTAATLLEARRKTAPV